nr:MAG TPA: hypothetical protein [Bacteriophage sp.]
MVISPEITAIASSFVKPSVLIYRALSLDNIDFDNSLFRVCKSSLLI